MTALVPCRPRAAVLASALSVPVFAAPIAAAEPTEPIAAPAPAQAATVARADPPAQREWYGWQTLIAVGASKALIPISLVIATMPPAKGAPWYVGTTMFFTAAGGDLLSGPIVHFAHGNVGKGFISLGMNLLGAAGGTFIGGEIGAQIRADRFLFTSYAVEGAVIGGLSGLLAAQVIDVAVLAYDEAARKPSPRPRPQPFGATLVPSVGPTHAGLALAGSF